MRTRKIAPAQARLVISLVRGSMLAKAPLESLRPFGWSDPPVVAIRQAPLPKQFVQRPLAPSRAQEELGAASVTEFPSGSKNPSRRRWFLRDALAYRERSGGPIAAEGGGWRCHYGLVVIADYRTRGEDARRPQYTAFVGG